MSGRNPRCISRHSSGCVLASHRNVGIKSTAHNIISTTVTVLLLLVTLSWQDLEGCKAVEGKVVNCGF